MCPPPADEEQLPASQSGTDTPDRPATLDTPFLTTGVGVTIIAGVALVWLLDWAQSFFVSLLVGILFAYTLSPLVDGLQRFKIPRVIATTVVMLIVLGALGIGAYSLRGQVQTIINQLPTASSKLSAGLSSLRASQRQTIQKIESAAKAFETPTKPTPAQSVPVTPTPTPATPKPKNENGEEAAGASPEAMDSTTPEIERPTPVPAAPPMQVVVEQKSASKLGSYLWAGSVGIMGFLGQALMVIFLVFFLLLAGDTFKRKLVRIAGSSKSKRKITVKILDDINLSIQRYMLMLLVTNVMVALLTWAVLRMIGLDNAGAWAVFAGVNHLIPYFGPVVTAGATAMAAYIQFGSFSMMLLVAGSTLVIATFIGTFVTTWMTGRIAKMNTAAVFISLLFWGWLWGVWGLLLAIPIIAIVKVISQHNEELQPLAELLGE